MGWERVRGDLHWHRDNLDDPSTWREHTHNGGDAEHGHVSDPCRPADWAGGADAIRAHIDRDWQPVLLDLIELEQAGALAGIRAIIAERLRQVRDGASFSKSAMPAYLECAKTEPGGYARAAAWLAAGIDRQEAGRGDDNG